MPRKVHPRSFAFTLSRRTLGEHRVHRLHDRHAFVQRHQGTLEEPFAEAAGDLVGLMPETRPSWGVSKRVLSPVREMRVNEVGA